MLLADLVGLERGEPGRRMSRIACAWLAESSKRSIRPLVRSLGVGRAADQLDHRVEVVEGDQEPLEDVRAGLGLAQLVLGAADHHLALVADVVLDQLLEAERPRHAVDEGDHVDPEGALHLRVLVELVEHDLRRVAPRLGSITSRMPERSDSSRRSEMPVIFLSRTRSAIFVIRPPSPPFLTMKGSSVTMIASLPPLSGSTWARARTRTEAAARGVGVADPLRAHDGRRRGSRGP